MIIYLMGRVEGGGLLEGRARGFRGIPHNLSASKGARWASVCSLWGIFCGRPVPSTERR